MDQIDEISFYSNSVKIPIQIELAEKLGRISGYNDFQLFLCNSGAEANENALKLASFHNGRKKVIAFSGSFHGRTSLAVAATDDQKIQAKVNADHDILFLQLNDHEAASKAIDEQTCAVIVEGIQGVAGIHEPSPEFLKHLRELCSKHGAVLILDEVQSGFGRSGHFFAHQCSEIVPDIITMAKGMGNGFPVAGLLIHPDIKPSFGLLGTTFGGNYLACAAALAVLEVIEADHLMAHAQHLFEESYSVFQNIPGIKSIRGKGLMIGLEFDFPVSKLRNDLVFQEGIFTGSSKCPNTLRLLPALNISKEDWFSGISAIHTMVEQSILQA